MEESNWKETLSRTLCQVGVIDAAYSGRVVINFNQGGVTEVEKVEKVEGPSAGKRSKRPLRPAGGAG